METSAKTSVNVEEAFFTLAGDIMARLSRKMVSFFFVVKLANTTQYLTIYNLSLFVLEGILITIKHVLE